VNAISLITAITVLLGITTIAKTQETAAFQELKRLMDSVQAVEAPVFAPRTFEKAKAQFNDAVFCVGQKRPAKDIDQYSSRGREFAENALKAAEVAKLALKEYLSPRQKARAANAPVLVSGLYDKAEMQFTQATQKVESGDVKGGLKEADKSKPLFDYAEIEAIRVTVLNRADSLIATAVLDEANKFALATLDRAKTAREKSNELITKNRYDRTETIAEATRAEHEAQHATAIAQSVRSLARNDQAWEKLMLLYELQIGRIGEAAGIAELPFYRGSAAAADTIAAEMKILRSASAESRKELADTVANLAVRIAALETQHQKLSERLGLTLKRFDIDGSGRDAFSLTGAIDSAIVSILSKQTELSQQMASEQSRLSELSQAHEEMSSELQNRQLREAHLDSAKAILGPTEGEMLIAATNDIVLRLFGLSFAAGKSEITEQHLPLLEKVKQILALFPDRPLVVEGHTDASGDPQTNTQLSDKRAYAIMQYLRQAMGIPSDRIRAIGYGPEKPIASQSTPEGKAKNRRIDIIIMQ
jgi:outer membrane protein OmpA-like peptidoglycan-associated protein